MVIGDGLIGMTFSEFSENDDTLIFASGVSNSGEINEKEFTREINLLTKHINTPAKLVYFSTCAIFDECLKDSRYVTHKKTVERLIKMASKKYLILRLPNVVSGCMNPHTSFNFYKNKLLNREKIDVQTSSHRYYIDIDDVLVTCSQLIQSDDTTNKTINVCFTNKIDTLSLINMMGKQLNVKVDVNKITGGCDYTVNNELFLSAIDKKYAAYDRYYNNKLVKKYVI
jgi:nucleoside-diphosphate-sugar epimerase